MNTVYKAISILGLVTFFSGINSTLNAQTVITQTKLSPSGSPTLSPLSSPLPSPISTPSLTSNPSPSPSTSSRVSNQSPQSPGCLITTKDCLDILSKIAIIAGTIGAIFRISLDSQWNRKKATHDFLYQTILGPLNEIKQKLGYKVNPYADKYPTYFHALAEVDSQKKLEPSQDKDGASINAILNYLEHMCKAIKSGIIEEDMARDTTSTLLFNFRIWLDPYIEERRRNQKVGKKAWEEVDKIVERWGKTRIEESPEGQREFKVIFADELREYREKVRQYHQEIQTNLADFRQTTKITEEIEKYLSFDDINNS